MEPVSHTTITITTDQDRFRSTAPTGDVYYTTITTKTQETHTETPIPAQDAREPALCRLKTTTRTTTRRQVHRVAPYPGARPVRMSSRSNSTTESRERVVLLDEE